MVEDAPSVVAAVTDDTHFAGVVPTAPMRGFSRKTCSRVRVSCVSRFCVLWSVVSHPRTLDKALIAKWPNTTSLSDALRSRLSSTTKLLRRAKEPAYASSSVLYLVSRPISTDPTLRLAGTTCDRLLHRHEQQRPSLWRRAAARGTCEWESWGHQVTQALSWCDCCLGTTTWKSRYSLATRRRGKLFPRCTRSSTTRR